MKNITLTMLVVSVLAAVTVIAVTGAPTAVDQGPLSIDVDEKNPWTDLDLNNQSKDFQFVIVTDRTGGRRPGIFTSAIERINLLQPEFVVSVGDLIQGGTTDPGQWALEWSEFQSKVEQLDMPFFYCAGNHDISNLPMSKEWHRKFGRSYYSFEYHNCLFLILNTEDVPERGKPYQISAEQQAWAIDTLKNNADVRWTIVLLHKPTWTYPEADPATLGWQSIEDALQDRPYTVFAGHKHAYAKYMRKGREYYMLATTGGASKLTGLADGRFDHFVWVTMKDDGPVVANLLLDGVQDGDVRVLKDPMPARRNRAKAAAE